MKFRKWERSNWSKRIDVIVGGRCLDDTEFPWDELQECTRLFLQKKALQSQAQIDETLLSIIGSHSSQAVALAACVQWISDAACTDYLTKELWGARSDETRYQQSLRSIIAVGRVKASVINSVEVKRAQFLLRLTSTTLSIGEQLAYALFLVLPTPSSSETSLQSDITERARSLCYRLAADLSVKVLDRDLVGVYDLTTWLSRPTVANAIQSNDSGARAVLNDTLPAWRAWAAWRPNPARKESWTKYSRKAPAVLKDLLMLEGADLSGELGNEQSTLRGGLVARCYESSSHDPLIGSVRVVAERNLSGEGKSLSETLENLTSLIDYATTADDSFTGLLAHFCVEQMISFEDIKLLECVRNIDDVNFTRATSRFFAPGNWPFRCVLYVIPFLGNVRMRALKEKMKVDIIGRISDHLTALRRRLLNLMHSGSDCDFTATQFANLTRELQSSSWLLIELDPSIQELIRHPPDVSKLENLHAIRKLMRIDPRLHSIELEKRIDTYVHSQLALGPAQSELEQDLIDTVISVCKRFSNPQHWALVIFVADFSRRDLQFGCDCIRDIGTLSQIWIDHIENALFLTGQPRRRAIQGFIRLLAQRVHDATWQRLGVILFTAIHKDENSTCLAQNLTFDKWIELLSDIRMIFQHDGSMAATDEGILFNPNLHVWSQQVALWPASVRRLGSALGKSFTLERLLYCFESHSRDFLALLETLDQVESKEMRNYHGLLDLVLQEIHNLDQVGLVQDTLSVLIDMEREALEGSFDLIRAQRQVSPGFAKLVFAHLIQSGRQKQRAQLALTKVARLIKVDVTSFESPAHVILKEATQCLSERYSHLIEEARRLENLRLSLQAVAPQEVWSLLKDFDIKRPSTSMDALACVPESLESVIEGVSEHEIEMRFPANILTRMQRVAIGVNDTDSFLVRLLFNSDGRPRGFCVHISGDGESLTGEVYHNPALFADHLQQIMKQECPGQFNRGVFQISNLLWHHLRFDFESLEHTYKHVSTGLSNWGYGCIVCGTGKIRLRRATTCSSNLCQGSYLRAPVEILLADIWQDPPAVDLLLASVYAVATVGNLSLLPNVPAVDSRMIFRTLQRLPGIPGLAKHLSACRSQFCNEFRLERSLSKYCKSLSDSICLAKCLVWMCNSYRGYLTSASRSQRIPWFGDDQFILVNSTPELEAAFSRHMSASATRSQILFHGTSMDRLYAILCQGLRVQSGTNLQQHGAVYGRGVYMADEPRTAWTYTTNSKGGWNSSRFKQSRVLLGCELAGEKPNTAPGIQVIKNPARLAVRYVFILNGDATLPAAKDVRVPMASMFQNFRSGVW